MGSRGRSTLLATALIALGFAAAHVLAVGAPIQTPLTYAGTVTDAAGKPSANPVEVSVAFLRRGDRGHAQVQSAAGPSRSGDGALRGGAAVGVR